MEIQGEAIERRLNRARNWESSNVEEVWSEFKKSVMETAAEVCGLRQCRNIQKRTRWWNEEVKQTVKNKEDGLFEVVAAADTRGKGEVPASEKGSKKSGERCKK